MAATRLTFEEAIAAYEAGGRESLLEPLGASLRGAAGDARLWHLHGLVLRELERREEAIASLRKAAELAPGSVKIVHSLARTLYEAGLPSIETYGQALRLARSDPEITAGLTSAFVSEGEPETAIAGLEQILARSPRWADGHVLLTKLRWAQGERSGFDRSFASAIQQAPRDINLWHQWILALTHAEQWDSILEAIAKGRSAIGEHPIFAINEAIVAAERGELERAETLFEPLADVDDSSVQIHRVRHYLRSGRPELADAIIGRWVDRSEGFMFWPYASLAWRMLGDRRWEWLEGDPSFVGIYDIADKLPPLDKLAETLRKLHTLKGQPLEQSLRGGTQTDADIFMRIDPMLVQLREAVRQTVSEHVARLPARDDRHPLLGAEREPIRFSGSWSVWLRKEGFHANHVHPAGWISSALYVVLPDDSGDGDSGFLTLGDSSTPTLNLNLPALRTVEPHPGRLVLFPSYMWHGTRPFGKGERITLAFDVAARRGQRLV